MKFETLDEIGERAGTDKQYKHDYLPLYDSIFYTFRFRPVRLFEIGFFKGGSAKMFAEYFPAGVLHVLDHSDKSVGYWERFPEDIKKRVILHKGDQGSRDSIRGVLDDIAQSPRNPDKRGPREFHVIIDDGSHRAEHQIVSFEELWSSVADGGYYIIEDLHMSYKYGKGTSVTMEYFIDKIHEINNNHTKEKREAFDIESICFPRNLIIIKKKESK